MKATTTTKDDRPAVRRACPQCGAPGALAVPVDGGYVVACRGGCTVRAPGDWVAEHADVDQ